MTTDSIPDTAVVTFTPAEVAALLALRPGPAADLSRRVLLSPPGDAAPTRPAGGPAVPTGEPPRALGEAPLDGLRSLIARRLVLPEPEGPRPVGAASVLGYTLTGADRWTTLALLVPEPEPSDGSPPPAAQESGTVLIVESERARLLLTPRPPGLLDVVPLAPETRGLDVVLPSATRWLERPGPRGLGLITATAAAEVTLAMGTEDGTSYWIRHGGGEHQQLDRDGALHVLRFALRRARSGP